MSNTYTIKQETDILVTPTGSSDLVPEFVADNPMKILQLTHPDESGDRLEQQSYRSLEVLHGQMLVNYLESEQQRYILQLEKHRMRQEKRNTETAPDCAMAPQKINLVEAYTVTVTENHAIPIQTWRKIISREASQNTVSPTEDAISSQTCWMVTPEKQVTNLKRT